MKKTEEEIFIEKNINKSQCGGLKIVNFAKFLHIAKSFMDFESEIKISLNLASIFVKICEPPPRLLQIAPFK